ncbi:MAG: DEAD/DEAH box helicase [Pseudomonadales bacterium]|nr:DEAD/DEAH box helicase [Pseudomonadales bacterium]MDP6472395.1 DEAD/DEAH box helicase [Pseudomonadales bacterium]MDP6971690.1 DEAD/DEAH box helicase [Pseudomonadales bacterium]
MTEQFRSLGVGRSLVRAVHAPGFNTPTPIQNQAIPLLLEGRDVVALAQTGTGKTATFGLPLLQHLQSDDRCSTPGHPRVLVVAPTRELAARIRDDLAGFACFTTLTNVAIFGGVNQNPQIRAPTLTRAIVFVRTKHSANRVVRKLEKAGGFAEAIHGNKSHSARQRALANFKDGTSWVLVVTDIAARGIDIDDVSYVINFELPHEPEAYVHRIGTTARAGAPGTAWSLVDPAERDRLRSVNWLIGFDIPEDRPGGENRRVDQGER